MNHSVRIRSIVLSGGAVLSVLSAVVLLGACGQKGPLVLPGYPKDAQWPYPPRSQPAKSEPQPRKAPDVPATSDSTK